MAAIEDLDYFDLDQEQLDSDVKQKIDKIILKKFMEQKINSFDQLERDEEISRVVSHLTAVEEMRLMRHKNKELDESKYEKELVSIQMRLGYLNPRVI